MKQRVTRELYEYWDALRGVRPAPDRAELDPGVIRTCLPDTFVLAFDPGRGHPFRIAGTAVCAMFGRELASTSFDRLWSTDDRAMVADLVQAPADNAAALVASITGRNADGELAELEMILLPLTCDDGAGRILGALSAVAAPYWLGVRPLLALHSGSMRHMDAHHAAMLAPGVLPQVDATPPVTKGSGLTSR